MSSVPGAFAENLRRYAPATRRLREAAQRYVDAAVPGAVATVAALPCREPGCPPVEVALVSATIDDGKLVVFECGVGKVQWKNFGRQLRTMRSTFSTTEPTSA